MTGASLEPPGRNAPDVEGGKNMRQSIIAELTSGDDRTACALADQIIAESRETDKWYPWFDAFAQLLGISPCR